MKLEEVLPHLRSGYAIHRESDPDCKYQIGIANLETRERVLIMDAGPVIGLVKIDFGHEELMAEDWAIG